MGYQALRLKYFEMQPSFLDESDDPPFYPMRGIKNSKGEWEYGALQYEDIQALKTDFFYLAMDLFSSYCTFGGTPSANGWQNERRCVLDIIKILKSEESSFDAWEMEKTRK